MTQTFNGANLAKTVSPGLVRAISALSFNATKIDLNNDTLEFISGSSIALTDGYLFRGVLYSTASGAIQLISNAAYFSNMTVDIPQCHLSGNLLISGGNTFKQNVTNNGILQNHISNYYILTIDGNFTNNGNIKDNYYYFTILISGNVNNNGSWKNSQTTLSGTND